MAVSEISGVPEAPAVHLRMIQMALQHLSHQRLFLSDGLIHNCRSFLLFDISQ